MVLGEHELQPMFTGESTNPEDPNECATLRIHHEWRAGGDPSHNSNPGMSQRSPCERTFGAIENGPVEIVTFPI